MTQTTQMFRWGADERAVFFRPWWRTAVTVTLTAIPVALTPVFAGEPGLATWLGPASVAPLVIWIGAGLRTIRRHRTGDTPVADPA